MTQSLDIRWMIRRDMPAVMEIEHESFSFPWSEEDLISVLRQKNSIGMVVEHDSQIVGFVIYELHPNYIHLVSMAVAKSHRRRGIGTEMMNRVIRKISDKRNRVSLEVSETNLSAQCFFRSCGLRAVRILRGRYDDNPNEDAYQFVYRRNSSRVDIGAE